MARVCIALGSNLADPAGAVALGWLAVVHHLGLQAPCCSDLVTSVPAEGAGGAAFCNAVGLGDTPLGPVAVLDVLQRIERAFGRDRAREGHHGARPLDLDLIDWAGLRLDLPDLALPHPRLGDRDFVLQPLAQIAPDFVDARSGRAVADLLARLPRRWLLSPPPDPSREC